MSNYSIHTEQLADMFKALGNPHRLALFRRLSSCCSPGTLCDAELAARHSVSELGEQGYEQRGPLLRAIQSALRRTAEQTT